MGFKYGRSNERIRNSRTYELHFFTPSSIGAFGDSTPKKDTPQNTIQQPTTMYGVNKVAVSYYANTISQNLVSIRVV